MRRFIAQMRRVDTKAKLCNIAITIDQWGSPTFLYINLSIVNLHLISVFNCVFLRC